MEPESPRFARPPLSLIEARLPGYGVDLYIGGKEAAGDLELLAAHNITTVVNCAVNIDLNYAAAETGTIGGPGAVRYYKVGLVDDTGNPATMMLAGLLILRGALSQKAPPRPSYNQTATGNVLVHCRAGRSRSVALAALFLAADMPQRYPTLDDAIRHVQERRELRPQEWFEAPKPVMVAAARQALGWVRMIDSDAAAALPVTRR